LNLVDRRISREQSFPTAFVLALLRFFFLLSFFEMAEMALLDDPRRTGDGDSDSETPAAAPFCAPPASINRSYVNMRERNLAAHLPPNTLTESAETENPGVFNVGGVLVRATPEVADYNAGSEAYDCYALAVGSGMPDAFKSEGLYACYNLPGFEHMTTTAKTYLCKLPFDELTALVKDPSALSKLTSLAVTLGNSDTFVQEAFNVYSNATYAHQAERFLHLFDVVTTRLVFASEVFGTFESTVQFKKLVDMLRHVVNNGANVSHAGPHPAVNQSQDVAGFAGCMAHEAVSNTQATRFMRLFFESDPSMLRANLTDIELDLFKHVIGSSGYLAADFFHNLTDVLRIQLDVAVVPGVLKSFFTLRPGAEFPADLLSFLKELQQSIGEGCMRAISRAIELIMASAGCNFFEGLGAFVDALFNTISRHLRAGAQVHLDYVLVYNEIFVKALTERMLLVRRAKSAVQPMSLSTVMGVEFARKAKEMAAEANGVLRVRLDGGMPPSNNSGANRKRLLSPLGRGPPASHGAAASSRALVPYQSASSSYGPASATTSTPKICYGFQKGQCTRGASCLFKHELGPTSYNPCRDFINGHCARGAMCRFAH
jgi:hypothetical protein